MLLDKSQSSSYRVIDTSTTFRPFARHRADPPSDWSWGTRHRPPGRNPNIRYRNSIFFGDPVSGYRGFGELGQINYHQVSLPRLLHGHNGYLIKSQSEIDEALRLLWLKAREIGTPCTSDSIYTRVDLVWQFRADPIDFIRAHRAGRHPRIHSDPVRYEARSIAFEGSQMRITMYDKRFERCGLEGDIVRVEVQLHDRLLREQLSDGGNVDRLDFTACYQAYRRILLGFVPAPTNKVTSVAEFLATAERENWQSNGASAFDLYTSSHSNRQIRRLKQQMAAARPAVHQIDWAELLPADGPPPVVELEDQQTVRPEHQHS